jgi:hypothetical protein
MAEKGFQRSIHGQTPLPTKPPPEDVDDLSSRPRCGGGAGPYTTRAVVPITTTTQPLPSIRVSRHHGQLPGVSLIASHWLAQHLSSSGNVGVAHAHALQAPDPNTRACADCRIKTKKSRKR